MFDELRNGHAGLLGVSSQLLLHGQQLLAGGRLPRLWLETLHYGGVVKALVGPGPDPAEPGRRWEKRRSGISLAPVLSFVLSCFHCLGEREGRVTKVGDVRPPGKKKKVEKKVRRDQVPPFSGSKLSISRFSNHVVIGPLIDLPVFIFSAPSPGTLV